MGKIIAMSLALGLVVRLQTRSFYALLSTLMSVATSISGGKSSAAVLEGKIRQFQWIVTEILFR